MPEVFTQKDGEKKGAAHHNHHETHKTTSYSPLSAYCHYPSHVKFVGADEHERIILLLRRHWATNVKWVLMSVILILVPLPFVYFPILSFMPERFLIVTVLFWYLVTSAYTLEKFLSWFFNVYIVTDERVFDVDFYNLVGRDISDATIDNIQDVTSSMHGVIRTSLNYGDVLIQTAAETTQIDFEAVPRPDDVAKILRDLRVEEEQEKLEGRVR